MNTWFTVKVKYTKQLEDGRLKRVTEPYLVDSTTFTDAEARIYEVVGQSVRGEFIITGITRTEYADVFYYDDSGDWYKCKLTYVSIDADEGKEKKISSNFLVTASSVREAYERIEESLSGMTVSFEIPSIAITPLVDVIPYESQLPDTADAAVATSAESMSEDAEEKENESDDIEADEEDSVVFEDETE